MKIILNELSVSVTESNPNLTRLAAGKLKISSADISSCTIWRRSLDARKKADIRYIYSLVLDVPDVLGRNLLSENKAAVYQPIQTKKLIPRQSAMPHRPVVVGAGPCGLFAALVLAEYGLKPLLIERGKPIAERKTDIALLENQGLLNEDSNVCFGEGGAGTFSDGKLTTRIKDERARQVLETFVACGASEEILYAAKPHLGTDGMRRIITLLRKKIESLGGEVVFGARLSGILSEDGHVTGLTYIQNGEMQSAATEALVLAIGHSAGDTYRMLDESRIALEKKACAVGFRIEHPRAMIDQIQYGSFAKTLGAADYSLTARHGDRGVYSFCMCPGGQVVCASSGPNRLTVNGMSYSGRDMANSNAAIVVTLKTEDTPDGALGSLGYIEAIERAAFSAGGGYLAPVQTAADYIAGSVSSALGETKPSYQPGTVFADLNALMPAFINDGIKSGLMLFDRQIGGFIGKGLLTGVETRTSSPIRITRGESFESTNLSGLYPAGEGAGYAGGIISAAVDGIRVAESIIQSE